MVSKIKKRKFSEDRGELKISRQFFPPSKVWASYVWESVLTCLNLVVSAVRVLSPIWVK